MLLSSAFSKENSAISVEEWVLVFKVFTTATRKFRVKQLMCYFRSAYVHVLIVVQCQIQLGHSFLFGWLIA